MRRAWASSEAFSHEGRHYRFEDYGSEVLPFRAAGIPIYFGGFSEAASSPGAGSPTPYRTICVQTPIPRSPP
ncbi:hypothetical protein [Streptomyces sp. NBC_01653]|uniref:hypothetical protein n=1 Tax=Streptomyces sp. NBC_01653 TaxID=2975908 RepID=UPI0038678284